MQEETHWSTCSHVPIVHVNSDFTDRIWCVVSDGSEDLTGFAGLAPTVAAPDFQFHDMNKKNK
jgi:hypothetical protein